MSGLSLVPHNVHDVQVGGQRMLFHIPTTGIFEMDEVSDAVFDLFKTHDSVTPDLLRGSLEEKFGPEELTDVVQSFLKSTILPTSAPRFST